MSDEASRRDPEQLGPPWTVLKILRWTTHYFEKKEVTESARLDAELLLTHVLDLDRVALYTHFDRPMDSEELDAYRALIKRRVEGEPVAYLIGRRGFWDFELEVDPRVLIPRPETEVLVEEALERIEANQSATIIDVGTGSGAIALALARERPEATVIGTDTSADALEVARENAQRLGLGDRVEFVDGDLFEGVEQRWLPCDFVVSNPPYVAERDRDQIMTDVRDFEPEGALFAGEDGLDVIRRLIPAAHDALAEGGHFLCEIGAEQGEAAERICQEAGFTQVNIRKDYSDRDRVVCARKLP
ncbi:MAG: peptide chain release factor N(5)-glutamine methyltransferase [Persicimonas sp.]